MSYVLVIEGNGDSLIRYTAVLAEAKSHIHRTSILEHFRTLKPRHIAQIPYSR